MLEHPFVNAAQGSRGRIGVTCALKDSPAKAEPSRLCKTSRHGSTTTERFGEHFRAPSGTPANPCINGPTQVTIKIQPVCSQARRIRRLNGIVSPKRIGHCHFVATFGRGDMGVVLPGERRITQSQGRYQAYKSCFLGFNFAPASLARASLSEGTTSAWASAAARDQCGRESVLSKIVSMILKGQIRWIPKDAIVGQAAFVVGLFGVGVAA